MDRESDDQGLEVQEGGQRPNSNAVGSLEPANDELPSNRQLSSLLDIPRERMPGLKKTLGKWVKDCHASSTDNTAMASSTSPPTPRRRAHSSVLAALKRLGSSDMPDPGFPQQPAVGDIVGFPFDDVDGVYWLVTEFDTGSRLSIVAVDQYPLIGPRDGIVDSEETSEALWIVRTELVSTIPVDRVLKTHRLTRVKWEGFERARVAVESEGHPRTFDGDLPAYREWIEEGPLKALQKLTELAETQSPGRRDDESSRFWPGLLAAVLAVVIVGLGWRIHLLERSLERFSAPIVDLPYGELRFDPELRGPQKIEVPLGASRLELSFIFSGATSYESYRIKVVDGSGAVIEAVDVVYVAGISVTFLVDSLKSPGTEIRVYGLGVNGTETLIEKRGLELIIGAFWAIDRKLPELRKKCSGSFLGYPILGGVFFEQYPIGAGSTINPRKISSLGELGPKVNDPAWTLQTGSFGQESARVVVKHQVRLAFEN